MNDRCIRCGQPAAFPVRAMEVRTLHVRGVAGERRVQALGDDKESAVCERCARESLDLSLNPLRAARKQVLGFGAVFAAGALLIAATFLFLDGAGNPRQIFRTSGLYLIPPAHPPSVLWEEDGNTYRKRADVTIQARLRTNTPYASALTEAPAAVPTVETPPQVVIH